MIGLRASPELRRLIEQWSARQPDTPSRSEAIRQLVELGLASGHQRRQRNTKRATTAADMAGEQIDLSGDVSATDEQRASRKRRLLKGPKEFREDRRDHPPARKG